MHYLDTKEKNRLMLHLDCHSYLAAAVLISKLSIPLPGGLGQVDKQLKPMFLLCHIIEMKFALLWSYDEDLFISLSYCGIKSGIGTYYLHRSTW
jgi:hypothetical protein